MSKKLFDYLHHFYSISVLFVLVACLSSCAGSKILIRDNQQQSLYDHVTQSGKIRCAYVIYPPSCIKDPNTGKLSGISVEALELTAKKLGLTLEWGEEVGWGTMLEGLQTGRYDMIATAVWTNVSRAKVAAFSNPLFYSPLCAYVKTGDRRFIGHLDRINAARIKIATIDGGIGQIVADEDYPQAHILSMPQMTDLAQNLLNVVSGKADVTFADPFTVARYLQNNANTIENASPGKPMRIFPDCWMFKRGEFEFKAMLDTVLDEVINSGAMDKIISKYEQTPNEVYRVALPYVLYK